MANIKPFLLRHSAYGVQRAMRDKYGIGIEIVLIIGIILKVVGCLLDRYSGRPRAEQRVAKALSSPGFIQRMRLRRLVSENKLNAETHDKLCRELLSCGIRTTVAYGGEEAGSASLYQDLLDIRSETDGDTSA